MPSRGAVRLAAQMILYWKFAFTAIQSQPKSAGDRIHSSGRSGKPFTFGGDQPTERK
jgi:hypothetical protein